MSGAAGLSTHVLDTARGCPAAGVQIELVRIEGEQRHMIKTDLTNSDGRTNAPLVERGMLEPGTYELTFYVDEYFRAFEAAAKPPFLDIVTLRFTVSDTQAHYHIPLLVSPWSYSTYRGS